MKKALMSDKDQLVSAFFRISSKIFQEILYSWHFFHYFFVNTPQNGNALPLAE